MTFDNWQEQLRRGALDLAILLTLAPGARYGLQIIGELEEYTDLVVTEGTIYPILGRLARQGLLEGEWVAAEAPHPRKYYRLTRLGRRRLEEMIAYWTMFSGKVERLVARAQKRSS
ncbi:MAG: PadR family transcriptional regulator [Acidimicrobiia bacterium]